MQLNPSSDFYDDDIYDSDDEGEPEILPEAKKLVQLAFNDRTKTDNNEEEEDMGYDEDDERIAIAVERPKELRSQLNLNNKFLNSEGSGGGLENKNIHNSYKSYSNERLNFDYANSFRQKTQISTEYGHGEVGVIASDVDLRESSGNFANDDEDNDDDSDDDDDSERFFNSKRKSNNRYFRKNTNDAIKIISTPLGKVGIVYQQTPPQNDNSKNTENVDKKSTTFTDFDALSPDPESSHRLASSHPKITPVLTPDGKVALLYRGDSENSKYEPIRNLTSHKFNNPKISETNSDRKKTGNLADNESSRSSEYSDADSTGDLDEDSDMQTPTSNMRNNNGIKMTTEEQAAILPALDIAPTTGSFIIRPTDSVLPMINRPLSEVLGIKKNQFKQFRIKDTSSTTPSSSESLNPINMDNSDTNKLHFLTKVNLADYPTSSRTRNYDFDFSRDNTMLDERSRSKEHQVKSDAKTNHEVIGTNGPMSEDILSKTEVVNLAIIPHFDEELERLQRLREYEERRHHRQRQRQKQNEEDLSGIHCIMQAMMGIAAISTVFGMLGTFFKQRILDQLRLMHW